MSVGADTRMARMILVEVREGRVAVRNYPVTRQEYLEFAQATGRSMPHSAIKGRPWCSAMTDVSQPEAVEYCRWRGALEGQAYRLPTAAELAALYQVAGDNAHMPLVWAQVGRSCSDEEEMLAPDAYMCEWTAETQTVIHIEGTRTLGVIFYPPWHSEGPYRSRARAAVNATQGYAFVSFRMACDVS